MPLTDEIKFGIIYTYKGYEMFIRIIYEEIMEQVYEKCGWLYWNISKSGTTKHSLAGSLNKKGYYVVTINGKSYSNHRILYQFYHNVVLNANDQIDHIDGYKQNNKKENLRLCTHSQNLMNRKVGRNNKTTKQKNICIIKYNNYDYYFISISKNGKVVFSETYRTDEYTLEEVVEIRNKKLLEIHGEFHNLG